MVWAVLFLMGGILFGDALCGRIDFWCWLLACFLLLVSHYFLPSCRVKNLMVLLGCLLVGAADGAFQRAESEQPLPMAAQVYKAVITSEPKQRGRVMMFDMLVTTGNLAQKKVRASLLCDTVTGRYRQLHLGASLLACSVMERPAPKAGSSNFDYRRWMYCHGYAARTFIYYRNWALQPASYAELSLMHRVRLKSSLLRERLLRQYRNRGLRGEDFAVVAAMTLGDRSMITKATQDEYAESGSSHILAISGLHLAILYTMITFLAGRRRWMLTQLILLLAVWAFVFLAGLSASMVRSAVMISIYSFCCVLGRNGISLNSLAVAAFFMLLVRPAYLWDVSFQMSFMAVAGIMLLFHPLCLLMGSSRPSNKLLRWAEGLAATSIASQLAVAPLAAFYFGRFPCYFLIANVIAIPGAWLILHLTLLFWICQPLSMIQSGVAWFMGWTTAAMGRCFQFISSLPGASISGIELNIWQLVAVYLAETGLLLSLFFVMRIRRELIR